MNFTQALRFTHSLLRFGIKPGLDRIKTLLSALGDPQKDLKCIHVAGTNGKGSVCAMLSAVLTHSGKKTGMFISPYVVEFCERIQIDGNYISKDDFAKTAQKVKTAAESLSEPPTEFEFITAVAFLYFKENNCDICVIETGLGGRLDSTNVIDPLCSVITKISFDHTNILGDTIEKIAGEKCGIIKDNRSVVTTFSQPVEALSVIMQHSAQHNSTLITAVSDNVRILSCDMCGTVFMYGQERYVVPLAGIFQIENAVIAIETLKLLSIPYRTIADGLLKTVHPARMQVISEDPLIILDGGHNKDGIKALKNTLTEVFGDKKALGVCGILADKDYTGALEQILPLFDKVIAVQPDNPRRLAKEDLRDFILSKGIECQTADVADLPEVITRLSKGRPTVIFGSLYLASQILSLYGNSK